MYGFIYGVTLSTENGTTVQIALWRLERYNGTKPLGTYRRRLGVVAVRTSRKRPSVGVKTISSKRFDVPQKHSYIMSKRDNTEEDACTLKHRRSTAQLVYRPTLSNAPRQCAF